MLKRLLKEDVNLIINFLKKNHHFDEAKIRMFYECLEDTKIICANIENNAITSMLITNIIKNNYYLEEVIYNELNYEEMKNLINFTVCELRKDERGLNIIYDNFPYNELMNQTMIENGFKCNFVNLIYQNNGEKVELIKPYIALNDKNDDVRDYIYQNYVEEIKSNDAYLGSVSSIPKINTIRLENTNVAVIRNKENKVIGTLRFGIVSDSLYLYSLYADNEETYEDLIVLVKNLTRRNIEVGFFSTRRSIIELLERLGFTKFQTDYILKLS